MNEDNLDMEPDAPIDFGLKMSWLAVRGKDTDEVVHGFGIRETAPSSWAKGLEVASEWGPSSRVFITPPLTVADETWVLVVGCGLPDPSGPEDDYRYWHSEMMERGAEAFGEVQYFGNHRVSSYTAWARLRRGGELRLFCHGDEPIRDEGDATAEETDLLEEFETRDPEEDDVMTMANHWSVNPMELTDLDLGPSLGQTGYLSVATPHLAQEKQQDFRWWATFKGVYKRVVRWASAFRKPRGHVVITARSGKLYLESFDEADTGLLIAQPDAASIRVLSENVIDEDLGSAVVEQLDACQLNISYDQSTWDLPCAIWQVAGVKSDRQLSRGSLFSSVSREKGSLQFHSTKAVKSGGYDGFNPPKIIKCKNTQLDPTRIGELVRAALAKSEGVG